MTHPKSPIIRPVPAAKPWHRFWPFPQGPHPAVVEYKRRWDSTYELMTTGDEEQRRAFLERTRRHAIVRAKYRRARMPWFSGRRWYPFFGLVSLAGLAFCIIAFPLFNEPFGGIPPALLGVATGLMFPLFFVVDWFDHTRMERPIANFYSPLARDGLGVFDPRTYFMDVVAVERNGVVVLATSDEGPLPTDVKHTVFTSMPEGQARAAAINDARRDAAIPELAELVAEMNFNEESAWLARKIEAVDSE